MDILEKIKVLISDETGSPNAGRMAEDILSMLSKDTDATMVYRAGRKDERDHILKLLSEGGEVKLYGLFHKDELIDVSEDREDIAHRENMAKGIVIAEKVIKLSLEQNHWIRREEWYPYGRQWRSKKCYNHPLDDPEYYTEVQEGEEYTDLAEIGKKRKNVIRTCTLCGVEEKYTVRA